jgi:hypothetical protein
MLYLNQYDTAIQRCKLLYKLLKRYIQVLFIKSRKFSKRKVRPANEITEDDVNFFLATIKSYNGYPKVRDLQKLLRPRLNLVKINTILRYLDKSKSLEIDLDGNITWFRQENTDHHLSLMEAADISPEFLEHFLTEDIGDMDGKDSL